MEKVEVLLIGPPNVGKSVIFNKLTGLDAGIANYAGTTVEYKKGKTGLGERTIELIDAPGTYTLNATNEAEKVALNMLKQKPEVVICVLDGDNLESSLFLLLQVLKLDLPTIAVINRIDLLEEKGDKLDIDYLKQKLKIPVIPTVGVTGKGINKLKIKLKDFIYQDDLKSFKNNNISVSWGHAEKIAEKALQNKVSKNNSLHRKKWEDILIQPVTGVPLAILILGIIFGLVVGVGMGIRRYLLLPLFRELLFPFIINAVENLIVPGLIRNILIGEYGFLIKGLEWPFGLVLPYVFSFYTALCLLEDSGYLPRLGILLDGLLNKIGLSGENIIPLLLGYGCAIPGIAATRAMKSYKERITVSTMICLSIPCISQTGAFISLLAERSIFIVFILFVFSLLALVGAGIILNKLLGSNVNQTVLEIPPLLVPGGGMLAKKTLIRLKSYLFNGALMMVYAIAIASVLYELGILRLLGNYLQPLVTGWLRLPEEAAVPLVLGIVRRELAVLPLLEMELTDLQLFVGAAVGLFYVPCIAVLAMLSREFKVSVAVMILVMTTAISFILGGIISRIGSLIYLL